MSAGGAAVQWGFPIVLSACVTWCLSVVSETPSFVRLTCQHVIMHDTISGISMQLHYIADLRVMAD